jgi:hypothetical protein
MRGPNYEKMKEDANLQYWVNHESENTLYYVIGKLITKIVIIFLLSLPLAWLGKEITPENLLLMNKYCERYLSYFSLDKPLAKATK